MESEVLPPNVRYYTLSQICAILKKAEEIGLPLDAGSWVEQLTLGQIDMITQGMYDAYIPVALGVFTK